MSEPKNFPNSGETFPSGTDFVKLHCICGGELRDRYVRRIWLGDGAVGYNGWGVLGRIMVCERCERRTVLGGVPLAAELMVEGMVTE